MFTTEEINYIARAVNEEVKQTGLQNAGMALAIVAKLQAETRRQKEPTEKD